MRLTEDHKPDRPDEAERIRGLGGDVVLGGRCWRVSHSGTSNPNLALTLALTLTLTLTLTPTRRVSHSGTSLMLATSRSLGDKVQLPSYHPCRLALGGRRSLLHLTTLYYTLLHYTTL